MNARAPSRPGRFIEPPHIEPKRVPPAGYVTDGTTQERRGKAESSSPLEIGQVGLGGGVNTTGRK